MFKKYNSLTNHTDKKFLNKLLFTGLTDPKVLWIAREKIHGTNFSFIVTSDSVTVAKRTDILHDNESFFEFEEILKQHREDAIKVRAFLVNNGTAKPDSVIQIYGEYAGDMNSGKKIQQSINYGKQRFYMFDISIDGVMQSPMDMQIAALVGKFTTPPLVKIGSFDELINLRNDFNSLVLQWNENFDGAKWTNDTHLEYTDDNTCEGFVMMPLLTVEYLGMNRVAIKHKNEKFSEKKNKVKNFVAPVDLTDKDKEVLEELLTFNTENRIRNVLSKTGVPTVKEFGKIMGLTVKDILDESDNLIDNADNTSVVKKHLINDVSTLIRTNWINIINGEF